MELHLNNSYAFVDASILPAEDRINGLADFEWRDALCVEPFSLRQRQKAIILRVVSVLVCKVDVWEALL